MFGGWTISARAYAHEVRRYARIGRLQWAAPQDWMCEPSVLKATGLTVPEHQQRTVRNFLSLRELAPDLPWRPVVQGWAPDDYLRCVDLYSDAGVDLRDYDPVGIGTICRRQDTASGAGIVARLAGAGLRLHGFGVKSAGLVRFGAQLASADSLAWSFAERRRRTGLQNDLGAALRWRANLLGRLCIATPANELRALPPAQASLWG
jgi:hypothetical protein